MTRVREDGLHDRCSIIVGVGPIVSPRAAHWMRAHVPGIHIPDEVIARLERARDPRGEGIRMCIETIQQIRAIEGVAGIHLMATKKEHLIQEIVHASGVLAGRPPSLAAKAEYACQALD